MTLKALEAESDVTPEILACVEDCLDFFEGEPLRTEAFIDRLCDSYADGWDLESYDNPAARRIMAHARKLRREAA